MRDHRRLPRLGFQVFENVIARGGIVERLRVPDGDRLSRTQLDGLTDFARSSGVKGSAYVRVKDDLSWQGLHIGDEQGSDLMSGAPIAVGKNHLDELFPARARHPDLGRVDSSGR